MIPEVKKLIEHYSLEPLPVEQILFTRTYCSCQECGADQPCGTAIIGLYCDEPRSVSLFHKLPVARCMAVRWLPVLRMICLRGGDSR